MTARPSCAISIGTGQPFSYVSKGLRERPKYSNNALKTRNVALVLHGVLRTYCQLSAAKMESCQFLEHPGRLRWESGQAHAR